MTKLQQMKEAATKNDTKYLVENLRDFVVFLNNYEKMIAALEWYADKSNYDFGSQSQACSDCGSDAREVLGRLEE